MKDYGVNYPVKTELDDADEMPMQRLFLIRVGHIIDRFIHRMICETAEMEKVIQMKQLKYEIIYIVRGYSLATGQMG